MYTLIGVHISISQRLELSLGFRVTVTVKVSSSLIMFHCISTFQDFVR